MKKNKTPKQRKPPSKPVYRYVVDPTCEPVMILDHQHPGCKYPIAVATFKHYDGTPRQCHGEAVKMARKCCRVLNPLKVSSRKSKGASLQKWVAEKISKLTGFACGKDKPIEARQMGQSGTDVRLEAKVLKKFPYSVECKNCETWSVPAWIEQAKSNQIEGTDWLLIVKRKGEQPVVVIDAEAFFNLLK